jgi:eukaryotic-like serine/threonine-protein kinase
MFCPRCHRLYETPSTGFCPHDGVELAATPRIASITSQPTSQMGALLDGRYAIRGLIGKGSMSRVYLAEDTQTGEPVAVKMLDREMARQRSLRERFLRELDVARKLEHPHIARILGMGELPTRAPFLVLEFLYGESVGDLLRRSGYVDPVTMLPLLRDAASALSAAHRAGIIHRDLKPDNLFLVGAPGTPYAMKVLDFALAKLQEGNLTGVGMAVGTLAYMAPEQAITDTVDARSDIYGLGVVMFRMFVGRLPFTVMERARLVGSHLFVSPPRPRDLRPEIDLRLEAVLLTAMRKNPDNRYPSMEVLVEDMERILGQREGDLYAGTLRRDPDVYEPKSVFAQTTAQSLYTRMFVSGALDSGSGSGGVGV